MKLVIQKIKQESPEVISLIFKKPTDFFYYPGQYLDLKLPVQDPYGDTRAFTISSSSSENFLMITFKKGITPFKKHLESLKIGDQIEVSHPAGTFTLDETEPAVFIAGGIGITPFRSILKYASDQKLNTKIQLIYSYSDPNITFKEEITKISKQLNNLAINFWPTANNEHLSYTNLPAIVGDFVYKIFYISGSQRFITDIKKHLIELGVEEFNIRTDQFDGY